MSVKVGVIGVGAIGRNHARIYAALESADLVAIYDADPEHARALAAEFGTEAVGSVAELVARVDAASVATPTVTHREIATQLLSAGKHVLVEKPISDSVDDAKAMIALAAEKGVDTSTLQGTGVGGRIRKEDVLNGANGAGQSALFGAAFWGWCWPVPRLVPLPMCYLKNPLPAIAAPSPAKGGLPSAAVMPGCTGVSPALHRLFRGLSRHKVRRISP